MSHIVACLRLVVVGIYGFAVVIGNVDRQLDHHFDIVVCHVQIWFSMIRSCGWLIWVINLKPTLSESHVSSFGFGLC